MRINIRGNGVTPEKIASALAACERDYGLKIKGATIYVRFENSDGQTVEPLQDGEEFSRDFIFRKAPDPVPKELKLVALDPDEPIPVRDMIVLCERRARRLMSAAEMDILLTMADEVKLGRQAFARALDMVMEKEGQFRAHALARIMRQMKQGF